MNFNATDLVRDNIQKMEPYSSARKEFSNGKSDSIFLDANENAFGSPLRENYNRYPDPLQLKLKEKISLVKGIPVSTIFLGNGSDEAIDLLFRVFCVPGKDNVIIFPPTYGMYEVAAATNDIEVRKVPLLENFQLDLAATGNVIDANTKLVFICSPNNPTGNSIAQADIKILLNHFKGLVIVDEAYIDYAKEKTFAAELAAFPNLVVLQTLSKAWGLAGLRLGMAFASEPVIAYLNKVKYPYNINTATQQLALEAIENSSGVNNWVQTTVSQREWLRAALQNFEFVETVYPSDANFLLVKMKEARKVYHYLLGKGIIVRDRSTVLHCDDCLRITIGIPQENKQLIERLKDYRA